MDCLAELGLDLDLVRKDGGPRLPHWDPRLWQQAGDELQCEAPSSARFRDLALAWAKQHLARQAQDTTPRADESPSHGRPEAAREISPYVATAEDGRKGGAGRAQAQRAEHGTGWASKNNPTEIRDWRSPEEWPAGAKPVTRKIAYDDLYRVQRLDYQYSSGDDTWTSPFAPELASSSDPRRAEPSPHVSFAKRILWQTYAYDWLGNTAKTDDDAHGFYDRSLGSIINDDTSNKPYQLKSANNAAFGGTRTGATETRYDAAGNLTRLDVKRNGSCLGSSQCSHRFDYRWDEVGRLVRARRWDVAAASITTPDATLPSDGDVDADLEYVYDASDERVIKTAHAGSASAHTVYIFDSLELRRTGFAGSDYALSVGEGAAVTETEVPCLLAHGVRLARVVLENGEEGEPRLASTSRQHVFFELGDHLGSTSVVLDKATSELVERSTYQAYGATESDYRPERWKGFREDYGFTGKEEDIEVGLQYFGKRFLSPYLGRWVSADPLGVHSRDGADLNIYAYVRGAVLRNVDPIGLDAEDGLVRAHFDNIARNVESHGAPVKLLNSIRAIPHAVRNFGLMENLHAWLSETEDTKIGGLSAGGRVYLRLSDIRKMDARIVHANAKGTRAPIGDIGVLWHESWHAYLASSRNKDAELARIATRGAAHYEKHGVSNGRDVFDEAMGGYIEHRVDTWWGAKRQLDMIEEGLDSGRLSSTKAQWLLGLERKEYDQSMTKRVFGYDSDGHGTKVSISSEMKSYADGKMLEGRIGDRFNETFTTDLERIGSKIEAQQKP